MKVGRNESYFTSNRIIGDNKCNGSDICKMIQFFVNNIYVKFGGLLF